MVYVAHHDEIENAIRREKRIKRWPRAWKIDLIRKTNPTWTDLYNTLL